MEEREEAVKKLIKEILPKAANIAMTRLLQIGVNSLIKVLLLMHKTPNQVETIMNDVIKILGIESNPIKFFETLTDKEKESFNLNEPLNEENYRSLLELVAEDIINNSIEELKGDKNGK